MSITEVFPNPTVKSVIFQIKFPNLFFIEAKIGDYQVRIMEQFPQSQLLFQRALFMASFRSDQEAPKPSEPPSEGVNKIWNFKSPQGIELNVSTDSLDLSSSLHKSYNNPEAEYRFRDAIEFAIGNFLEVADVPIIKRIGLRYIDQCHIPEKANEVFQRWYATTFPLDRFPLSDAAEMLFKVRTKKGNYNLRFSESLKEVKGEPKLQLDFDGYATDIPAQNYLAVADELHELISSEYETCIKEPVREFMRKPLETGK